MLLEKLTVSTATKVIREVKFNLTGVSLITSHKNSVGKTTLLRLVDFCFGSNGKDIYTDKEFKENIDRDVHDFLITNSVQVTLSFFSQENKRHTLVRGFGENKDNYFIDNDSISSLDIYKSEINKRFFKLQVSTPSLRQIMPKFIRKDEKAKQNTINYLHDSNLKVVYESLRLFLFGFANVELLTERLQTQKEVAKFQKKIDVIQDKQTLNQAIQALKVIETTIKNKEKDIDKFQLDKMYEENRKKLTTIQKQVSKLNNELAQENLRLEFNKETLEDLKSSISNIDQSIIREIYEEAKSFIPDLQKSFDSVVDFHNKTVRNKISFVENHINKINKSIEVKNKDLQLYINEEVKLIQYLKSKGTLDELQKLQKELNNFYQKKGEELKFIKIVSELENELKNRKEKLEELNQRMVEYKRDFQTKIDTFNEYFSDYSNQLYNINYFLYYDEGKGKTKDVMFDFKIQNIEANVGGGKKKSQISAFDLAYISFVNKLQMKRPRFVLYDSLEDVSLESIDILFDIANSINGQFIISMLKNVLEDTPFFSKEEIDKFTILELSENEKFFKI